MTTRLQSSLLCRRNDSSCENCLLYILSLRWYVLSSTYSSTYQIDHNCLIFLDKNVKCCFKQYHESLLIIFKWCSVLCKKNSLKMARGFFFAQKSNGFELTCDFHCLKKSVLVYMFREMCKSHVKVF